MLSCPKCPATIHASPEEFPAVTEEFHKEKKSNDLGEMIGGFIMLLIIVVIVFAIFS